MEDAVRPSEQAFREMYERGYRTWFGLDERTIAEPKAAHLASLRDCAFHLENPLLNHPAFPENLALDASFSNTVVAAGISTWRTTRGPCDLPSFDQEFCIQVASDHPVRLFVSDSWDYMQTLPQCFGEDENHITVLVLAWTYILSAQWAEIMPDVSGPQYSSHEAGWVDQESSLERKQTSCATSNIYLGDIGDDAARWWAAVLAFEAGWIAYIPNDKGKILHSPWYTKFVSEHHFTLSRDTTSRPLPSQCQAASFSTALGYLSSYCEFHKVAEQSSAALAAALLLPVARFDNRRVELPLPHVLHKVRSEEETGCEASVWSENLDQFDRLLTLSCNAVGTKALLNSVFFEPDVVCNICGAWLQGTFAVLDSDLLRDQKLLLRVLTKRDPGVDFSGLVHSSLECRDVPYKRLEWPGGNWTSMWQRGPER